ncbi:MAG: DUF4197 domain-containing protein [Bryobacteraceae bacterium]|nr:DUF4197 domain-containing protein [Bryobacteraceae bacterium]
MTVPAPIVPPAYNGLMVTRRLLFLLPASSAFGQLDQILGRLGRRGSPGGQSVAAALKEALSLGVDHAIRLNSAPDGYFRNAVIKILLPEQLRGVEKALRLAGAGRQIDDFVLSMNRAAEKAAPLAKTFFKDAILTMTFDDAQGILTGGDTAATTFFKARTTERLTAAFRPPVASAMNDFAVTRQFNALLGQAARFPFVKLGSLDLESYVVGKALDGLFFMIGEEERKIRRDPAARVTALLRDVFGKAR